MVCPKVLVRKRHERSFARIFCGLRLKIHIDDQLQAGPQLRQEPEGGKSALDSTALQSGGIECRFENSASVPAKPASRWSGCQKVASSTLQPAPEFFLSPTTSGRFVRFSFHFDASRPSCTSQWATNRADEKRSPAQDRRQRTGASIATPPLSRQLSKPSSPRPSVQPTCTPTVVTASTDCGLSRG